MIIINLQEIQYLGPADAQVMIVRAVGREPKNIYKYILLGGTDERRREEKMLGLETEGKDWGREERMKKE